MAGPGTVAGWPGSRPPARPGWTSWRCTPAVTACVAAVARAIVLEALGAGNAGRAVVDAVARLCRDGVTVAIASRVCGAAVYPGYGPGRAMVDAGAVAVSGLGPPQARVLLMAALAADLPVAQTVARFS